MRRYNDQRFSHSSGILIVAEPAPRQRSSNTVINRDF
ncbi:MAG: hypothetical protein ACI8P0_006207 [Planctomycetaceae bacterium]